MNYQLLIESYSLGSSLSEQEIQLLSLELETQIMNINISTDFGCFKSAPTHICESLNFFSLDRVSLIIFPNINSPESSIFFDDLNQSYQPKEKKEFIFNNQINN